MQERPIEPSANTRQRAIFDSAIDFAIVATDIDGRVTDWNKGAERIFGWAPGEIRGSTVERIFTPEDRAAGRAGLEMRRALADGRASDERWHLRKDASRFWATGEMMPLRDGDSHIGFLKILRDGTDVHRAKEARAASEAQFRTFAEAMPHHVWTSPPSGLLDWFNERVYAYSGAAAGELDGEGWAALVHPDDIAMAGERWGASLASGAPYETEFRLRRADGEYRWHLARAMPIRGADGTLVRWIGTNTDIADQKATAEALAHLNEFLEREVAERTAARAEAEAQLRQAQKMDAIGQLTGGVAHDFNNLLQVISANLQLIGRYAAGNDDVERRVQNAQAAVRRGAQLSSQLLAFGRRQPLEPRVIHVGRLVSGMDDMLRRALGEGIDIETSVPADVWNTLVDPAQAETALLNLAINARDAMASSGKLTIEVGNAVLDADYARRNAEVTAGQYVVVAVSDTGSGMSAEVKARAFEPFFSTKPVGKGTGLGLSMVYGLAKQSGGHVQIYSEIGHGTTVRLYLPRAHQAEDDLVVEPSDAAVGGSETILVAEDDEAVRGTVVELLSGLGYQVLTANNATAALEIAAGAAVDLLFTDVVMPGPLQSPELARRLRERIPNVAVLFTSGYTDNAIVHGGRLDAGVDLLPKPYTREALARKIRQVLARRFTGSSV